MKTKIYTKISKRFSNNFLSETKSLRRTILRSIYGAQASHIASAFSVVDVIYYLYSNILKVNPKKPDKPDRDRFVLSKGWAASAQYAVLAHRGFFSEDFFIKNYCQDGSPFIGITTMSGVPGIEATTGSMGHGLPIGIGMAIAGKKASKPYRVFVLISDGELDEGSTWEGIFFAGHHKLDNLVVIIDYNKLQSFGAVKEILDPEPLKDKLQAFKWSVKEINGHDLSDIQRVFLKIPFEKGKPSFIIADTIKGKGVSFMENNNVWHYKAPNKENFELALKELSS